MKKIFLFSLLAGLLILGLSSVSANRGGPQNLPTPQQLEAGMWNQISPGGETTCSRGTEYSFFVRPGDESKLMIHFQGGGACWNKINCSDTNFRTFDDSVTSDDMTTANQGIFDFENPDNPVGDYTTVMVPYCTGDVHVGNTVVDHDGVQINHKGRANAEAVLAWVYENYPDPQNVFVNGCSAGSYGSIFYAPSIADQYPEATFAHLGDAGLGVSTPAFDADGLVDWGFFDNLAAYFPDISQEDYTFSRVYESAAAQHPESFFTQYTALEDNVQKAFYELQGGDPAEWPALAQARLDELDPLENFAYFTASGDLHCILPLAEFYAYETNGARFVDWVAALAAGEAIETVSAQP